MPLSPNTTILGGKYTIIGRLGKGAFARVWLAEDHAVGQQVAIKELRLLSCRATNSWSSPAASSERRHCGLHRHLIH